MNRIVLLLVFALTIGGHATAQPSKGKKKTTAVKTKVAAKKTIQEKEEEGRLRIAVAQAVVAVEKAVAEVRRQLLSDSSSSMIDTATLQEPYQPYGWVNDFTNLFTPAQQTELDSLITALEKATTIEMAIVTIDSTVISRNGFDDYITALGNRWGLGKKDTNNGVVIGICPSYKRIRISTGLGIQQQLTDQETKAIIDNIIIPQYRLGDYFNGTKLGLLAVMQELR
jgi:uncharacterized protein